MICGFVLVSSYIRLLDTSIQNTYRFLATKKLKQIINTPSFTNVLHKRQAYVLKAINQKLNAESALITQSDKGKTTVIIYMKDYSNKVQSFITDNINTLKKDPTNKYQKSIQKIIKESNLVISKRQTQYLVQKKPSAPDLKAQLKLHKINIPI